MKTPNTPLLVNAASTFPPRALLSPPPHRTCVTPDEPALTRCPHPEPTVHVRVTLGVIPSGGLDKWMVAWTHHHSVTQDTVTALKFLCTLLFSKQYKMHDSIKFLSVFIELGEQKS